LSCFEQVLLQANSFIAGHKLLEDVKMKKIMIRRAGGPDVFEIVDAPLPLIGENEVLIDIKAIGLNWSEVMIRRGDWQMDLTPGVTLGAEGVGVVEAVGRNVTHIKPGDRAANFEVLAYWEPGQGNYAEKIVVSVDKVLKFPDHMSFAEGAAVPMAMLTAYDALINHSPLPEVGTVVVTACTGAVGIAALQMARRKGLRVIGTTRSHNKKSLVESFGVEALVYSDPVDLKEKLLTKVGGNGIDYVFDPVGGATASQLLAFLNYNGSYLLYGSMDASPFASPPNFLFHQLKLHGYVVLRNLADPKKMQAVWSEILPLIETKEVHVPVHKTFAFDKVADAHREMERHEHFGKIILTR
jgi:NADPH:quinone reductase-like Zn-dependent oxidoreductase